MLTVSETEFMYGSLTVMSDVVILCIEGSPVLTGRVPFIRMAYCWGSVALPAGPCYAADPRN